MRTGTKSIKLLYKPLNAFRNTKIVSGSVRQNYDTNTLYFEPDRRIDPLVVLVECGVNDPHNFKNGLVNADLTNVTWKISKAGALVDILDSDKEFQIGKSAEKGQLKVLKNIPDTEAVTLLFTAKYLEPTTKRIVNFQETFTLITSPIAAVPALLELSAPYGHNLFPTKGTEGLVCQADLWRGTKPVAAAYYWYKNGVEITDTNGFKNSKTNKLYVPAAQIPKTGQVYKVEVADCSQQFNELVKEKVEQDLDVVESRSLYEDMSENVVDKYSSKWQEWTSITNVVEFTAYDSVRVWKEKDTTSVAVGVITSTTFDLIKDVEYKVQFLALQYYDYDLKTLMNYCYIMHPAGNIQLDVVKWKQESDTYIFPGIKGNLMELVFKVPRNMTRARFLIGARRKEGEYSNPDYFGFYFKNIKISVNSDDGWSPSKNDLENLISEKTKFYEDQTSLPPNYRPASKPNILYKGDYMLMTKYPKIVEQIIGPEGGINPDIPDVDFEMVLNSADGIIESPEKYYSVGWLKQTNGTFKYKGFKIKIPIAEIIQLNAQNKELDYELREDLTLK